MFIPADFYEVHSMVGMKVAIKVIGILPCDGFICFAEHNLNHIPESPLCNGVWPAVRQKYPINNLHWFTSSIALCNVLSIPLLISAIVFLL